MPLIEIVKLFVDREVLKEVKKGNAIFVYSEKLYSLIMDNIKNPVIHHENSLSKPYIENDLIIMDINRDDESITLCRHWDVLNNQRNTFLNELKVGDLDTLCIVDKDKNPIIICKFITEEDILNYKEKFKDKQVIY